MWNLLGLFGNISLHQDILQYLLKEICKTFDTTNLKFVWSYFKYKKILPNLNEVDGRF